MPSPESLPEVDIILITHNHLDLTIQAIKSLYDNTPSEFRLIIVDDSTDITPEYVRWLQKQHDNIDFIHSDEPYKSGNQIFNIGLAHCKNDYVATVMNSVTVEPEWEVPALQFMEANPDVGILGFKCLFPNGLIESAGIDFVLGCVPVDIASSLPGHRASNGYDCPAVQWAFALLRRKAIPVLEEDVYHGFRGMDDIDNCFVVRKNGWRIMYFGLSAGYHAARSTRGVLPSDLVGISENLENHEIFYKRWGMWDIYQATKDKGGPWWNELVKAIGNPKEERD
jgi:glycosyltransferase involved in cell wall biosynthesis